MKKTLLIVIGVIFSITISFSQENKQDIKKSNLLGINIGATTGIGISSRDAYKLSSLGIKLLWL